MIASQINSLHASAMERASEASLADMRGDKDSSRRLLREAFELERTAADAVAEFDTEPSRSVLILSAAYLAMDCLEFREAERLIALAFVGLPPVEVRDELIRLAAGAASARVVRTDGAEGFDSPRPDVS